MGEMDRLSALALAKERGLDLVEINPSSRPPVCKIMDFGKYKYDLAKKTKEQKARQKEVELKEIRLSLKIGEHDLQYRAENAKEFFHKNGKVKVSMMLRGRENAFVQNAYLVFEKFSQMTGLDYESRPQKSGNIIVAMLAKEKETAK